MMSEAPLESLPSAELAAMVRALQETLVRAETRIATLEAELARARGGGPPKTAANSSMPPAKGWKARRVDPPPGTERAKRGPKVAHAGVSRTRVPRALVDVVLPCRPTACDGCGAALPRVGGTVAGRRQVTELPPVRPVVIEA